MSTCSTHYKRTVGFTLLEILVALFIFTIFSMLLVGVLHREMDIQARTERRAEQLRCLQMALLMVSRDISQVVNRPILTAELKEEPALVGTPHAFTLTHAGVAESMGMASRSTLQRTTYRGGKNTFERITWDVLDRVSGSRSHRRLLLTAVAKVQFQYADQDGRFYDHWPQAGQASTVLPRAVKISLTFLSWGSISQLYVISAQAN